MTKGFIYEIKDLNSKNIYIGSSSKKRLTDRISDHKYSFVHGKPIRSSIILASDKWAAKIIDNIEYEDKKDLLRLEQKWIDEMKLNSEECFVVNKQRAISRPKSHICKECGYNSIY